MGHLQKGDVTSYGTRAIDTGLFLNEKCNIHVVL